MSISENATSLSQEADNSLEAQLARFYTTLTYLPKTQLPLIQKAFQIAKEAHEQQKRSSGEPYITHPLAVAQILADMHVDADTLCAAILHDVLEDTRLQKKLLIKEFNTDIADLVDGVSKLSQVEFSSKAEAQAENYRKMLLAMTRDIRVIIVKLADRLHNMRTLAGLSEAKKQRVSRETLEIYAPLANRLGMHNIRVELEELAFQAIYPLRYRILHDAVFKARGHRQEILHAIRQALREKLDEHHISASSVLGRQKHLFSIYEKMREKHLSFGEIMDIYGFRIVVPTRDDCYRVLGSVHNLFKPVPGKFKDYIAIPKSNGYQSLHTILFGPEGVPIEIQIRTAEMDNFAENGVAAHWLYKTHESHVSLAQMKINHWLKNLIEMQNTSGNSEDFIESVKIDLFPDEVYVFSPKGKILELPGGATPIDFAYAVHTDIGNHCIGARIDRRPAALSSKLYNGQTVEIITSPEATPKQAWLNIAVTGRARSAIKHFLKEKQYDVSIALGKQLVLNALLSLGETNPNLNTRRQNKILKHYTNYEHFERLLSAVGLGQEAPIDIAQTALGHLALSTGTPMPLVIKGTEGMVLKFAPCCYPLPGDTIVGVLVPNEGLWVHRDNCPHAQTHLPTIPLHWDTHPQKEFKATLMLDIENRQGVLARLTASVAEAHINIQDIRVMRDDGVFSTLQLTLSVNNTGLLQQVIKNLRHVPMVLKVERFIASSAQ